MSILVPAVAVLVDERRNPTGWWRARPPNRSPRSRPCAASYAAAMSGWSAAASDQDFGPLTTISTNRSARVSSRRRAPWQRRSARRTRRLSVSYVGPSKSPTRCTVPATADWVGVNLPDSPAAYLICGPVDQPLRSFPTPNRIVVSRHTGDRPARRGRWFDGAAQTRLNCVPLRQRKFTLHSENGTTT